MVKCEFGERSSELLGDACVDACYQGYANQIFSMAEDPQSVRSLISAQWIFRGDPVSAPDSSRQAGRMVKDEMLRYLGHGRQVFRNPRSLHLSVDGVAAGGDHQNVFFAWLPVKRLAGVPPLQDWRVGKHVLYV